MKISSDFKYLVYGLSIGAALAVVLGFVAIVVIQADAASPSEEMETANEAEPRMFPLFPALHPATAGPTPTFTPTPTDTVRNPTPTVTFTPSITPTPTATLPPAEEKLQNGGLVIVGPLSKEQQMNLYGASLNFIALTTKESTAIGESFAGKGYGSPTLICGPLSIAILQHAGLLDKSAVAPLDFWLLNPFLNKDRALANRTFPPDKYENRKVVVSIRNINYADYPLYPGDFLYIKHGWGGTFDHMLVVNRVDNMGRAYSVTNYEDQQGFIINEVLLYDPNDSSAGIFKKWTARRNSPDGATGFGGFELWRLRGNP